MRKVIVSLFTKKRSDKFIQVLFHNNDKNFIINSQIKIIKNKNR